MMRTRSALLVTTMLAAGCAAGPDFQRPAAPDMKAYTASPPELPAVADGTGVAAQRVSKEEVPERWWTLFGSARLDALVDRALQANPNIEAARAALLSAQESVAAQRGAYWPQMAAGVTPMRQKIADSLSSPLNAPVNPYSLHTAQLTVAYTPDVFGGNRRQVESLEAGAEFQRHELAAARLSIATNVVNAAIQEASLRGQIAATEKVVSLNEEMLALTHRQLAVGAVSQAAVAAQETVTAQAKAGLPPLRKQLAVNRDLLIALTGGFPDREIEASFELADLRLPTELPISLPSRLVERRPDVRAAEALAHAASAQIGVAQAARLPQLMLTADVGSMATVMADLFKAGSGFWGIAGTVAQPIFAGGTLAHRQGAAEAAYGQAIAQYRATVIAAYQNVADALHALRQDEDGLRAAMTAEQAAERSLVLARRQVVLGDISHLSLLNAEQAWRQATVARVQAQAARYADTAALFQALGGGWVASTDTNPAEAPR